MILLPSADHKADRHQLSLIRVYELQECEKHTNLQCVGNTDMLLSIDNEKLQRICDLQPDLQPDLPIVEQPKSAEAELSPAPAPIETPLS